MKRGNVRGKDGRENGNESARGKGRGNARNGNGGKGRRLLGRRSMNTSSVSTSTSNINTTFNSTRTLRAQDREADMEQNDLRTMHFSHLFRLVELWARVRV